MNRVFERSCGHVSVSESQDKIKHQNRAPLGLCYIEGYTFDVPRAPGGDEEDFEPLNVCQ